MTREKPATSREQGETLRRRAEQLLRAGSTDVSQLSAEDVQALVHELRARQVELERLNEELEQRVNARTADLRRRTDQLAQQSMELERRADDLRRLAAELSRAEHRERKRLAKLLHDGLQQVLIAVKSRVAMLVDAEPDEQKREAARLDELVAECLRTSRNLSQELSPPILQVGTLAEGIEWLGPWFGDKHGLTVAVDVEGELPPVPEHLRVFLFQSVRELLFNVVKHSGKMRAGVGLSRQHKYFTVQVEDDGERFDPEVVEAHLQRPEGFGLFNIRERLEALGGRLEIGTTPQGGACFRLIVPVADEGERERRDEGGARSDSPGVPSGRKCRLVVREIEKEKAVRAEVDKDLCTGCELCTDICPAVFEMGEDDLAQAKVDPVPPDAEDDCREAADQCPVEAIKVEG
jgi:signal transduction histidine kinase/ferredoxin